MTRAEVLDDWRKAELIAEQMERANLPAEKIANYRALITRYFARLLDACEVTS